MTSTVIAVLVVTLLLPGLALLFAVVIRFLTRGAPRAPEQRVTDERNGER
jgi:hypothetical protein